MLFLRFVNRLMSEIIMPILLWYNLSKALDFGLLHIKISIFLHFMSIIAHLYAKKAVSLHIEIKNNNLFNVFPLRSRE